MLSRGRYRNNLNITCMLILCLSYNLFIGIFIQLRFCKIGSYSYQNGLASSEQLNMGMKQLGQIFKNDSGIWFRVLKG